MRVASKLPSASKDRYKKRNARLTRDGKRCSDASPCPRLLLGGRMPSFHSPPTHTKTSRLFRRKTHSFTRPISVKLALVSSVERVGGASRAVHYGDRFPGAFGDGTRGREGCCCYPATYASALTSEEEENLLVQLFERRTQLKLDKQRHLLSNGRYDACALVGVVA